MRLPFHIFWFSKQKKAPKFAILSMKTSKLRPKWVKTLKTTSGSHVVTPHRSDVTKPLGRGMLILVTLNCYMLVMLQILICNIIALI